MLTINNHYNHLIPLYVVTITRRVINMYKINLTVSLHWNVIIVLNSDHHKYDHVMDPYYPSKLHKAVMEDDYNSLTQLLSSGEDPDTSGCIGSWIRGACVVNRTPLHCASQRGNIRSAVILLMGGANPNCTDDDGYTPLHYVCQQYPGSVANQQLLIQIVEALVDYGGDFRAKTTLCRLSPVDIAERMDNKCCVKLLSNYCEYCSFTARAYPKG